MDWEKLERSLRISWENGQPRPIVSWVSQSSLRPCGQSPTIHIWHRLKISLPQCSMLPAGDCCLVCWLGAFLSPFAWLCCWSDWRSPPLIFLPKGTQAGGPSLPETASPPPPLPLALQKKSTSFGLTPHWWLWPSKQSWVDWSYLVKCASFLFSSHLSVRPSTLPPRHFTVPVSSIMKPVDERGILPW